MKKLFSYQPAWFDGIFIIRIIIGIYMIKYGWQVFDAKEMNGMAQWLGGEMKFPAPLLMAYLAKGAEFFGGVLLVIGLYTKVASLFILITMVVAAFIANGGKIFGGGETSFLYLLFSLLFFFTGPGKISVDYLRSGKK
jgi:putative oxidoreductase